MSAKDAHHPDCYQSTGVPDDLPSGLCDCRVLRMIEAAAPVIPPAVACRTCEHPEGYDRLSGPCPDCQGTGVTPPTGGWHAESLIDLRLDAAKIVADMDSCTCPDNPHMNALHDLAHDVARVLGPAPFLCYPCARGDQEAGDERGEAVGGGHGVSPCWWLVPSEEPVRRRLIHPGWWTVPPMPPR